MRSAKWWALVLLGTFQVTILGAVGPASAQFGPHKANYIGSWAPAGQDDNQMVFQVSQRFHVWDLGMAGLRVEGAFTQTTRGLVHEQSAPFQHDFKPETWITRDLWAGTSVDYGWEHGSTGVAGDESRSWDRQYARFEFARRVGPVFVEARPTVWWAFHVSPDTEPVLESRALRGRLGVEGFARVMYEDKALVDIEASKGRVQVSLGLNTVPGSKRWYATVFAFAGDGLQLVDLDQFTKGLGVGMTLVP